MRIKAITNLFQEIFFLFFRGITTLFGSQAWLAALGLVSSLGALTA